MNYRDKKKGLGRRKRKSPPSKKSSVGTGLEKNLRSFLTLYPESARRSVMRLRKIVRTTLPESTELVSTRRKIIRYSIVDGSRNHFCCYIAPAEEYVRLGIDPGKFLSGAHALSPGSGARIRHLTIRNDTPIPVKAVQSLLVEAAIHLLLRKAITS